MLLVKKLRDLVSRRSARIRMVFLSELDTQWPWSPTAPKDYSDKEIYTQIVTPSLTNQEWVIPVSAPMPGYAYVGIRIAVAGKSDSYAAYTRFVGENHSPIFGHPYDIHHCVNTKWTRLSSPLVHKLFQQPIDILLAHDTPCFGKVELLAQKLEDEDHS